MQDAICKTLNELECISIQDNYEDMDNTACLK